MIADPFSPDYPTARERFRNLTRSHAWRLDALPIPGSELFIDVAEIGDADAPNLLIFSSGLHGLEAPFGSAVQIAWLESLQTNWQPAKDQRIVLVHVINPWGAIHHRRFNAENVDLNRNFLQADQFETLRRESEQSDYRWYDPYINPPSPPGRFDFSPITAAWLALRFGMKRLRQVLPVGQYAFPKGLFYGGSAPAAETRVVMENAPRWVGSARRIVHLDFHTGLGKWTTYKLLSSDPPGSPRLQWAARLFGPDDLEAHGGPTAYPSRGDMGEWLHRRFADRELLSLVAEFGTYGPVHVFGALRAENRAHYWGDPQSIAFRRAKRRAREALVPASAEWRRRVVVQSLSLLHDALAS